MVLFDYSYCVFIVIFHKKHVSLQNKIIIEHHFCFNFFEIQTLIFES